MHNGVLLLAGGQGLVNDMILGGQLRKDGVQALHSVDNVGAGDAPRRAQDLNSHLSFVISQGCLRSEFASLI